MAARGPLRNHVLTRFYKVSRHGETPCDFEWKPNAFLMILEAVLRFWLQNDHNSTGFIRYSHQLFWMLQTLIF